MAAADIRAARAYIELLVKDSKLASGLTKVGKRLKSFGASVSGIGLKMFAGGEAMAAPLQAAAGVFAEMGTAAARSSQKTGLTVEATSTLGYAAKVSGVEMDSLEKSVGKMSKTIEDANEGSKEAQETLDGLGLSVGQLSHLSQEDRLKTIATAISQIKDPAERSSAAMKVFGDRAGNELLPLLDRGAAGITQLQQHARDLGLEMSGKDANAALEFSDKLDDFWQVLKMASFTIGSAVVPALQSFVEAATDVAVKVGSWISQHKALIATMFLVATGITAAGAAVVGLGVIITSLCAIMGAVVAVFSVAAAVVGTILSPIGLVVAGIVGAGAALWKFTTIGQSVGSYLGQVFAGLKADVLGAFGGIVAALKSNQWQLAAQIAWSMVQLEFEKGKKAVLGIWDEIQHFYAEAWASISAGAQLAWSYVNEYLSSWDGAKTAASKFMEWFHSQWQAVIDAVADAIQNFMGGKALKGLGKLLGSGLFGAAGVAAGKEISKWAGPDAASVTQEHAARDAQQEADYKAKQAAIDQQFASSNPQLVAAAEAGRAKILADLQKTLATLPAGKDHSDLQKTIDKLQSQLASLESQANNSRGESHKPPPPPGLNPDDLNAGLDNAFQKVSVASTFDASAIQGMFGGTGAQHLSTIAQESVKTNGLIAQLVAAVKNGQQLRYS